jgi:hypothetical protein
MKLSIQHVFQARSTLFFLGPNIRLNTPLSHVLNQGSSLKYNRSSFVNFMQQSPSREASKLSWSRSPLLSWDPIVRYCVHGRQHAVPEKLSHYTERRRLGGEEMQLLLIHDLGIRWGWMVSVKPRPLFSPGERTPGTYCTGGWVGPRAGLDTEARGKILSPLPVIEPLSPVRPACRQTL